MQNDQEVHRVTFVVEEEIVGIRKSFMISWRSCLRSLLRQCVVIGKMSALLERLSLLSCGFS